jgi:hypothetical protein
MTITFPTTSPAGEPYGHFLWTADAQSGLDEAAWRVRLRGVRVPYSVGIQLAHHGLHQCFGHGSNVYQVPGARVGVLSGLVNFRDQ